MRTATLEKFKNGDVKLLIASDVAARGLDIPDVSHVLNYDVPMHPEDYIHRIGRTGRAGKKGHAITIATPGDAKALHGVQSLIGKDIPLSFGEKGSQTAPAYTPKAEKATTSAPAEEKPRGRRRVRVRKPKTDMQNPVMDTPKVPSPESAPAPAQANSAAKTKENIKTADRKPKSRKKSKKKRFSTKGITIKKQSGLWQCHPKFL
ncbi:MAG: helicase-related protein [Robiginitomaculum sp.]|nr:helicase-related protein [Robiginitomaculum sp.]